MLISPFTINITILAFYFILKVPLRNENSIHLCYMPFETEMKRKTAENNVECFVLASPTDFHSYFSMLHVSCSLTLNSSCLWGLFTFEEILLTSQHESDHIEYLPLKIMKRVSFFSISLFFCRLWWSLLWQQRIGTYKFSINDVCLAAKKKLKFILSRVSSTVVQRKNWKLLLKTK